MASWTGNELREQFLSYFESKGHKRLPSASLVPHNDPTLLLTGAGMVPFKPYFLGLDTPQYRRVTTCQRCLRTADIDNVGITARHGTFFEMLGNFSFGDYFKQEAIEFAWEYVTEHLKLPVDRLWVTIYQDDDEAFQIWNEKIGVPRERIVRLGREDNFWEIGVGPCGPCSEIHYDRGEKYACGSDCKPGCDCERFLEFWNLVFIQYHQDEEGNLTRLKQTGIDTGMGLERIAVILQDVENIFETDLVRTLIDAAAALAGCRYKEVPQKDVSLRVIADHMRGAVFLAHDGVIPSNEGRGYVFRRLLRRAVRHGRLLGIREPFTAQLAAKVVQLMLPGYPELEGRLEYIQEVLHQEEERFSAALAQGSSLLEELIAKAKAEQRQQISGAEVFRLYDTYGFPVELTAEIAKESGLEVDVAGFREEMEKQRQRARAAQHKAKGYLGDEQDTYEELREVSSVFQGYEATRQEAKIVALVKDGHTLEQASPAEGVVELVLDQTPFYAEGGGQVADCGSITSEQGQARVLDVFRPREGLIVHEVEIIQGTFRVGEVVQAQIDEERRRATARNHTATHLLHRALKDVLGEHVNQSGSQVTATGLRFDFTHLKALSQEELARVERLVNEQILANLPVLTEEMEIEAALAQGAVHLFDEKYGNVVRVVKVGDYSKELCGGTHVRHTGEIGLFRILSEGAIAAGIRRIEAVTGLGALELTQKQGAILGALGDKLNVGVADLEDRVEKLLADLGQKEKTIEKLEAELARGQVERLLDAAEQVEGVAVLVTEVQSADAKVLRQMGDELLARLGSGVILLGSRAEDKVLFLAKASKDVVKLGVNAGTVIKETAKVAGGGGGGRPDMAQAGGKDPGKLADALAVGKQILREQLTNHR